MDPNEYKRMFELETNHWWFVGRQELVAGLLENLKNRGQAKILDVGCGTGGTTKRLARFGNVIAIDNSLDAVRYFSSQDVCPIIRCSAQELCFRDHSFDFVLLLDVLEHLPEDDLAIKEISRILNPGGFCILTVPAFGFMWGSHDIVHHHFRRYSVGELRRLIAVRNLEIRKINYWNSILFSQ